MLCNYSFLGPGEGRVLTSEEELPSEDAQGHLSVLVLSTVYSP